MDGLSAFPRGSMSMTIRAALAVVAFLAATAPSLAAAPEPAAVFQAQPLSRLLSDYRAMLKHIAGPTEGDDAVKQFDEDLKDMLGERGFEGVDINRPIAGYAVLKDKPADCGYVLLVPITNEKDFLEFLGRVKIKFEAVKDKKGVYELELPNDPFSKDSFLRITENGWAYFTFNEAEPTDAKNLLAPQDVLDNADPSLLSVRVYPGRVPENLLDSFLGDIERHANDMKAIYNAILDQKHLLKIATTYFDEGPKLVRRYTETGLKEATGVSVKFRFDAQTGETNTEITVTPKVGTPFAKALAAKTAVTNRFAGMIPKNAVVGGVVKVPMFAPELLAIGTVFFEGIAAELNAKDEDGALPAKLKPVVTELAKGFVRAVKAENMDAAFAVLPPNKDGKYTILLGVSFDDPTAIEKAIREAAKDADLAKDFKLDVAKVGGVSIHKVPLLKFFPADFAEEIEPAFGEKSPAHVAFTKDAVFLAFGPDSLAAVKTALGTKPGPAPALEITANADALQKFAARLNPTAVAAMDPADPVIGKEKTSTMLRITIDGGKELKVQATMNVRSLTHLAQLFEIADP